MHIHVPVSGNAIGGGEPRSLIYTPKFMLACTLAFYVLSFFLIAQNRAYINYNETDFVQFTITEAMRHLAGEPLLGLYHPPAYPILIATLFEAFGDWLVAGLFVSFISGILLILASYSLYLMLGGKVTAIGMLATLLTSSVLIGEATRASTDMLFAALLSLAFLLCVKAMHNLSYVTWLGCGLFIGSALLVRSNGLALIALCLAPLLVQLPPDRRSLLSCLTVFVGIVLPLLALIGYGQATGSNVFPTNNHLNLAVGYFADPDQRGSLDETIRISSSGEFKTVVDVLMKDPIHIARTYAADFYQLITRDIWQLIEAPLSYFFAVGVLIMLVQRGNKYWVVVLVASLGLVMLTNMKPFEVRYYLFLAPLMAAGIGYACASLLEMARGPIARSVLAGLLTALVLGSFGSALVKVHVDTKNRTAELAEVVPAIKGQVDANVSVVARKPHLAFHVGAQRVFLPDLPSLDALRDYLTDPEVETPSEIADFIKTRISTETVYLFYGEQERRHRPQYQTLSDPDAAPAWLEPIAHSAEPGQWVVYRFIPELS